MRERLTPKVVTPRVTWTELRPMRCTVPCPRGCGGEMVECGGEMPGTAPMQWRHRCNQCNTDEWYADAYPQIVYKTVEMRDAGGPDGK